MLSLRLPLLVGFCWMAVFLPSQAEEAGLRVLFEEEFLDVNAWQARHSSDAALEVAKGGGGDNAGLRMD